MSKYIAAEGNLVATPELKHDAETGKPYAYVKVRVTDRYRDDAGTWQQGASTDYSVRLQGKRAENVVAVSEAAGNIAVVFAGEVQEKPWGNAERGGTNRTINRPTIFGYDAIGQDVSIAPRGRAKAAAQEPEQPAAGGPF